MYSMYARQETKMKYVSLQQSIKKLPLILIFSQKFAPFFMLKYVISFKYTWRALGLFQSQLFWTLPVTKMQAKCYVLHR